MRGYSLASDDGNHPVTVSVAATAKYNGHTYERYDSSITWTDAKAYCESRGGHLVTIQDSAENAWITNTLLSGCAKNLYFIGATDAGGAWAWVSGEAFSFTNWDQDKPEPTNNSGEDYGAIMGKQVGSNKSPGEWIDIYDNGDSISGYELYNCGFICEYEPVVPTIAATGTYNGHTYERYDSSVTWLDAKGYCESRGGHLVTIQDSAENTWITNTLLSGCAKNLYFIGATDTGGTWAWVTGEAFSYTNWDQDKPEPTDKDGEDYGAIMGKQVGSNKSPGEWIDIYNDGDTISGYEWSNCGFICEFEPRERQFSYNANGGSGSMSGFSLLPGESHTLDANTFKKTGYSFGGWNVKRLGDNKWYVTGKGWLSQNEINTNNYTKSVYADKAKITLNNSWINGYDGVSDYTFYAVWLLAKPTITKQPVNTSAAVGGTATFSVTATGATGYQWQFRKSADSGWGNASADGNKTATLNVPVTANKNGYQYRCAVTNEAGTVYSAVVTLTVTTAAKPTITKQPVNASVAAGGTATFSVTATGATGYQWQYRTSSTGSWANSPATGNTTATLTVDAAAHKSGYQYRCKVTNAAGSVFSNAATLTVTSASKPTITKHPTDEIASPGTSATFSVTATGATGYQWQYRTSSTGSWANSPATGNTTATLTVDAAAHKSGYQYRCKVTNAAGSVFSNAATLTVTSASKPTITKHPTDEIASPGMSVIFIVRATGATSYQWQYRTSSTGSWANSPASGNTTGTLTVDAAAHKSGYQYRCKVTNAAGSVFSNAATLTVVSKPTITKQPTNASAPVGGTAVFSVTASGATGYQWQFRKSADGAWANATASGNATATLNVPVTANKNGYQYRCVVSNEAGTVYTSVVTLSVG